MSYSNIGQRIRERLLAQGYRRENGEPDVQRFSWDFRFNPNHVHAWLRNQMAPFKHLTRLCDALACTEVWLLEGREREGKGSPRQGRGRLRNLLLVLSVGGGLALSPSRGVAASPHTLSADNSPNAVRLIGSRRRRFWATPEVPFTLGMAYA